MNPKSDYMERILRFHVTRADTQVRPYNTTGHP